MSTSITRANSVDAAFCAEWMAISDPWVTLSIDRKRCERALSRDGTELFVARDAGIKASAKSASRQPLGFILLAPYGFASSPYIASIGVSPAARGCGIGSALLNFAEAHFAERPHLFLLVSSFNLGAQRLYLRHGFSQVGELADFVVAGYSEFIFHKKLNS